MVVAREHGPDARMRVLVQELLHPVRELWVGPKGPRGVDWVVQDDELVFIKCVDRVLKPCERLIDAGVVAVAHVSV